MQSKQEKDSVKHSPIYHQTSPTFELCEVLDLAGEGGGRSAAPPWSLPPEALTLSCTVMLDATEEPTTRNICGLR